MKKRFFSFTIFLLIMGSIIVCAGTPPSAAGANGGKISQLIDDGATNYVAVLENGNVTAFFIQPDPSGDADDTFLRSVLKDAYDGNTPTWIVAKKNLYNKSKVFYQYDGKTYKKNP